MRGLVITNKYAQPLVIKRLGMDRSCLADSNNSNIPVGGNTDKPFDARKRETVIKESTMSID